MKLMAKLIMLMLYINILFSQDKYPIEITNIGHYTKVISISGKGEKCRMEFDIRNNTLLSSNCRNLTNSKGIQIHCTQGKKVCKTQREINDALMLKSSNSYSLSGSTQDKPFTHIMLTEKYTYVCVPSVRLLLDGSKRKIKLSQKEIEENSFFFRYDKNVLYLGESNGEKIEANYINTTNIGNNISADIYLRDQDSKFFSIIYAISMGKMNKNGHSTIPLVRTIHKKDGTQIKSKDAVLYFGCSNTTDY